MMTTSYEYPVDQRFLEWCCCSVASGLAIASRVTATGRPSKFNSCRIPNQSLKFKPLRIQSHQFNRGSISRLSNTSSSLDICAAAFNSSCVEMETEPLTRRPTRTLAPFKGKSKLPSLDDGGNRLPPRGGGRKFYDGGEGNGHPPRGGGLGGGNWWGEFFFGLFRASLALLSDMKEDKRKMEEEDEEWRRVARLSIS